MQNNHILTNMEQRNKCYFHNFLKISVLNNEQTSHTSFPELEKSVSLYKEFWSSLPVSNKYQSSGQTAS